jgi:hypothetical protein
MRVLFWGTYDLIKPWNRVLLDGLRENGIEVVECRVDPWRGIEDRSQIRSFGARLRVALRWLASYPILLVRYLRAPPHDLVIVGYMGQLDVLLLWPLARLRGRRIAWYAVMSLYFAVVSDRRLFSERSLRGRLLRLW